MPTFASQLHHSGKRSNVYLQIQASNALTGGDDGDSSEDSDDMAQTLLEIDYETVIDDEDIIDEFCTFKATLEGKRLPVMVYIPE